MNLWHFFGFLFEIIKYNNNFSRNWKVLGIFQSILFLKSYIYRSKNFQRYTSTKQTVVHGDPSGDWMWHASVPWRRVRWRADSCNRAHGSCWADVACEVAHCWSTGWLVLMMWLCMWQVLIVCPMFIRWISYAVPPGQIGSFSVNLVQVHWIIRVVWIGSNLTGSEEL